MLHAAVILYMPLHHVNKGLVTDSFYILPAETSPLFDTAADWW